MDAYVPPSVAWATPTLAECSSPMCTISPSDHGTRDPQPYHCYLWNDKVGGKGPSEIMSIFLHFIKAAKTGVRRLVVECDVTVAPAKCSTNTSSQCFKRLLTRLVISVALSVPQPQLDVRSFFGSTYSVGRWDTHSCSPTVCMELFTESVVPNNPLSA